MILRVPMLVPGSTNEYNEGATLRAAAEQSKHLPRELLCAAQWVTTLMDSNLISIRNISASCFYPNDYGVEKMKLGPWAVLSLWILWVNVW